MSGGDILGVGVSALLSYKRNLATVGHNIANVNTEGYSRQRVSLETRGAQETGVGFFGAGVQISTVERVHDQFVAENLRNSLTSLRQFERFHELGSRVTNVIADSEAGLDPALQGFFEGMQSLANDPSSFSAREVMLSEAGNMVNRFHDVSNRLSNLGADMNTEINALVAEVNSIASSIGDLNNKISLATSTGVGNQPNDLLDTRDQLVQDLAQRVNVRTILKDDNTLDVFVGKGQGLVVGNNVEELGVSSDPLESSRLQIVVSQGTFNVDVSSAISGGELGAVLNFRDQVLYPAMNAMGRIAYGVTSDVNAQHRLGLDINGNRGQDIFTEPTPTVSTNAAAGSVSASVTDTSNLTASDYRLQFNGGTTYTLTRLEDNQTFNIDTGGADPYQVPEIDGLTLTITAGAAVDDVFLIQPTRTAARQIDMLLSDPAEVAAAGLVRGTVDAGNTSEADFVSAAVVDDTTYVADDYDIVFADEATQATVDGATNGVITDAGAGNSLEYQLEINGVAVYNQAEGAAVLADLDALATEINNFTSQTGVAAHVYNSALYLTNSPASGRNITVNERLQDSAGAALDAGDQVVGYFGTTLDGTSPLNTLTYTTNADSYLVFDSGAPATIVDGGTYTDGAAIAFNGIEAVITGAPNLGDIYNVDQNINGRGDNRNAMAMADLQFALTIDSSTVSYQAAYGQLITDVGLQTRQAGINKDAQQAVVDQAVAEREAASGVNLDEEAANMIAFQQAYQAAAQMISVADNLFQTLLNSVGR